MNAVPAPPQQNAIQPAIENIQQASTDVANKIADFTNNVANNVAETTKEVTNNLKEFASPQNFTNATQSFVNSNSIIAKFVFILLVVIVFLFLLNLGIKLIGYFLRPPNNPYLVNGMISGTNAIVVSRDPKKANSVTLKRSNNQKTGLEFTWSVWLNLQYNTRTNTTYSHIFSVGNNTFDETTGIASVSNGPGLYLANLDGSGNQIQMANLHIVMDTISDGISYNQTTDVSNVPYNKWFNVILRVENSILDVYINGVITSRLNFINVPRQNYEDVLICQNGGFIGSLSNLRYYDYALNVFEIMGVVYGGPNLSAAKNINASSTKGGFNYLSNQWYSSKLTA
jgi:hypothetical protein